MVRIGLSLSTGFAMFSKLYVVEIGFVLSTVAMNLGFFFYDSHNWPNAVAAGLAMLLAVWIAVDTLARRTSWPG